MSSRDSVETVTDEGDRLRQFIAGVTDYAIYMLTPEGRVASWNAGAQRFKGYHADEIIGEHFSRFYTEEDRAAGVPAYALRHAVETGKFEAEGWRMRKDGSRMWAHGVIDPIRNPMGELIGFAKITRDITERKAAAEQLEKTREALFQAQKLEAIGKLTGGVAHDFNNLLNVVGNGLAILQRRLQDPADRRLLATMDHAVRRGATLTEQLLSFARQQPMKQEARDLNRVIAGFEPVLRRAGRSGLEFETVLETRLPPARIDVAQFETALLNLLVNARDATPDGGRIVISTQWRDLAEREVGVLPAGRYVAVSVQDTGAGMPPEVIARAVEPFFTTKDIGKGTGLGLSQVYGMVQQSGGDLAIQSQPGEGTTVTLFFPASDGDTEAQANGPAAAERVLVVDDQPDVLEMAGELLRTLGFDVLTAGSGEQALELLKRTPGVQLLFTDVVMPGMSGVDLARKAKAFAPELKVLLASGYAGGHGFARDDRDQLEGFQFLAKPFQLADLVQKLRVLERVD
ncbi:ATP-binding protein [Ramlibacter sp. MMS24-I3-19]|uniref:PAS domain-containing sensor histidine kinase n=1 Tax=Ramlibacter sp. MMS24-I3-19 TaxID=3416606 RepID=UPI003D02595C